MRKLLTIFFLLLTNSVSAQEWYQDFNAATIQSGKEDKNLFLLFSGSDWCVPCITLKKEVLATEIFRVAAEDYILANADFPRKALKDKAIVKQNESLAERYNPRGIFPLIVIIDPNGEKIATLQYDRETPQQFLEKLDRVVQL